MEIPMIYAVRTDNADHAIIRILFQGYEISIAMDDGYRGRDLTRAFIRVYKDKIDVSEQIAPELCTPDGIGDNQASDLWTVMNAIAKIAGIA